MHTVVWLCVGSYGRVSCSHFENMHHKVGRIVLVGNKINFSCQNPSGGWCQNSGLLNLPVFESAMMDRGEIKRFWWLQIFKIGWTTMRSLQKCNLGLKNHQTYGNHFAAARTLRPCRWKWNRAVDMRTDVFVNLPPLGLARLQIPLGKQLLCLFKRQRYCKKNLPWSKNK